MNTFSQLASSRLCLASSLLALGIALAGGCARFQSPSYAMQAQELAEKGELDTAVEFYKRHVEERLSSETRPADENPFFYYLLIGDIYLDSNRPAQALEAYLVASNKDVDRDFIADRLRLLAHWYREHQQPEAALQLLQSYRDLDQLLFDADIDALHKELVGEEQSHESIPDDFSAE